MLTLLRQELREALRDIPVSRPMSIRRSGNEDSLLSCDLPLITDDAGLARFTESLSGMGWTVRRDRDRLELDKAIPLPEIRGTVTASGEAACCLELLRLHGDGSGDTSALRLLAKATEQGYASLERLCRQLHRQWAGMLREGRPLPGALLPYLEEAINILK